MTTHVHIHLPTARTTDAFNEADHPRDGGKFTTKGSSGGTAQEHKAKSESHAAQLEKHAPTSARYSHHAKAAAAHQQAYHKLLDADHSRDPKIHGNGTARAHVMAAQRHADEAARHETHLAKPSRPRPA